MPPLEPNGPNGPNGARNRGYGANGPAVNGPAIERNLIQLHSDSDDDQLDPTGEAQDVNQPKNGNHEFQDVGSKDAAPKGDMEDTIPWGWCATWNSWMSVSWRVLFLLFLIVLAWFSIIVMMFDCWWFAFVLSFKTQSSINSIFCCAPVAKCVFYRFVCVFVWLDHWTLRWFIVHDQLCTFPGWEFVTQERAHPRYQEHWTSHQQGAINAYHFSWHCQKELQGFVKVDIFVETEHKHTHSITHTRNLNSFTHDSSQWLKLDSGDGSWCYLFHFCPPINLWTFGWLVKVGDSQESPISLALRAGVASCGLNMEGWFSVGKERRQRLEIVISKMFHAHRICHQHVTMVSTFGRKIQILTMMPRSVWNKWKHVAITI